LYQNLEGKLIGMSFCNYVDNEKESDNNEAELYKFDLKNVDVNKNNLT